MKLDIKNFNPYLEQHTTKINELIEILNQAKTNLSSIYFNEYDIFLDKIYRFTIMMTKSLNNEINNNSPKQSYFYNSEDKAKEDELCEEDQEDDNISIGSISEYEEDDDADEIDEIKIEQFFENIDDKYILCCDRFDFEYDKLY
jgi:hypothetical protein